MHIKKGEIWIMDLGINIGSEQNGKRPCFVLHTLFKEKTCVIIPGSNTKRSGSFIYKRFNWLPHQMPVVDKNRRQRKIKRLLEADRIKILEKIFNYFKYPPPYSKSKGGRAAIL